MAYEESLKSISVVAASDLSASQYCAVTVNSSGKLALTSAGAPADGILQDKPSADGRAGQVGIDGVTKVKAGAAFNAGVDLTVGTSGKLETAGTGDAVCARSLEAAGADGDIVSALLVLSQEPL